MHSQQIRYWNSVAKWKRKMSYMREAVDGISGPSNMTMRPFAGVPDKVNSRAKVQSPKIRNNNPVEPKNHTHKPGRQNGIGQRFSLNNSSDVHKKPHTPRSYLKWKPTGRIFKTVSLRWIPTGKVFIDSTTKVDNEPPNGSNDDITNPYECNQTLYEFKEFKSDEHASNDVWTKQFKPRSSSNDIRWQKRIFLHLNLQDEMNRSFIAQNSYRLERETFSKIYRSCRMTPILHISVDIFKNNKLPAYKRRSCIIARRIVSGPDPEPMQEDQTGSNSGKLHVSLAGPNPEHMDDEFLATAYPKVHENLKLITDERVIEENPESHLEKTKVIEESDSTIPGLCHPDVTSNSSVIAPFTDVSSTKPLSLVTPLSINTEATTITTSLPEITPFITLQLRVARLEQEMSEVKKTDHSAYVLASIKSQVPTVVDEYLGTKLDDALLKILE
ncbi:hypothetical protein Tco_1493277 [Tanacetum coccineum]